MLSYQHAYHAGNHADVLKHIVLIAVLEKLSKKAKPFFALDTHAGAGIYDLANAPSHADVTAFDKLVAANVLINSDSSALNNYCTLINELKSKSLYPGSPMLLSYFSRNQDNVHVNELSAAIFIELEQAADMFTVNGVKLHLHQRNGFELLKALMPPSPNRGMVLIDPPYEQAKEYQDVISAATDALKKWPNGTYMIWYPLLSPTRINRTSKIVERNPKADESANMLKQLCHISEQTCTGGLLTVEFANVAPSENIGMYGSGICLINPPYQIEQSLNEVLTLLKRYVQKDNNDLSALKWQLAPL